MKVFGNLANRRLQNFAEETCFVPSILQTSTNSSYICVCTLVFFSYSLHWNLNHANFIKYFWGVLGEWSSMLILLVASCNYVTSVPPSTAVSQTGFNKLFFNILPIAYGILWVKREPKRTIDPKPRCWNFMKFLISFIILFFHHLSRVALRIICSLTSKQQALRRHGQTRCAGQWAW